MIDQTLSQALQKEIPILTAQIRSLYAEFDKKFHLNGAKIPITFGMEPDLLGSYTRGSCHEKEHIHVCKDPVGLLFSEDFLPHSR